LLKIVFPACLTSTRN